MLSRSQVSRSRLLGRATLAALALVTVANEPFGIARAQTLPRDVFAREPKTPLETWEVVTYLLRVGQPAQAAPYVKRFLDAKPDDATLLEVRDTYGAGSVLGLGDHPETRPYARPMAERLAEATTRNATDPARIDRFVAALSKSHEEQKYAIERLRDSGSYAIPAMIRALSVSGLDASQRTPLAESLARLDRKAVPALIASLDDPDDAIVGDVARALGRIGDTRAIPSLTYLAARKNPESAAKPLVLQAIRELTGKPFSSQARSPVRVLSDEARNYHLHAYKFPGDPVVLWLWDASDKVPKPVSVPVKDAEGLLGLRFAKEALEIDPSDVPAKVVQLSLGLDHDPAAWKAQALEAGPSVMGQVVRQAIADGRTDLAATATAILGQVSTRDDLTNRDKPSPLIDALFSTDRRVQFAAAEAMVKLDPKVPFLGSSRVVPVLARFVAASTIPRAIVIDGNVERAGRVAGFLRSVGYETTVAWSGARGFADALGSADVELIAVDPNFINDPWKLADLLGNLKADARTARIPVLMVGPLDLSNQLAGNLESFPDVRFLVTPSETKLLKIQVDRALADLRVRPLAAAERGDLARRAATLLAQVGRHARSAYQADLPKAEPWLGMALGGTLAPVEASRALAEIPGFDSQRSLADVVIDPSRDGILRLVSARDLARNVRRFGPKLAVDQEKRLVAELAEEADPNLREALAAVVGSLKPGPDASATTLPTSRASAP